VRIDDDRDETRPLVIETPCRRARPRISVRSTTSTVTVPHPTDPKWPGSARIAVNFNLNV
jgi:hypothetical protein